MAIGDLYLRLKLQSPSGLTASGYADVETVWGALNFTAPSGPENMREGAPTALAFWAGDDSVPHGCALRVARGR
jgi:hypothetical protein